MWALRWVICADPRHHHTAHGSAAILHFPHAKSSLNDKLRMFCTISYLSIKPPHYDHSIYFINTSSKSSLYCLILGTRLLHIPNPLIITSLSLTRLNKHTTLDLRAEVRIVSHSQHKTTVRPSDLTDGKGMPKLNPSPGDHQWSMSVALSWGSNYLISGCPRFPGHSPDPQRPPLSA